jgi:DNA polymerase-1
LARAVREIQLPTLITPLKEHKLKKEGYYATNVDALTKAYKRANKKTKEIIDLLLTRAKIEKLKSSYLEGIPKLYNAMGWINGYIHGQFNHIVVATGRLASAKPNQQNIPEEARGYLESRF